MGKGVYLNCSDVLAMFPSVTALHWPGSATWAEQTPLVRRAKVGSLGIAIKLAVRKKAIKWMQTELNEAGWTIRDQRKRGKTEKRMPEAVAPFQSWDGSVGRSVGCVQLFSSPFSLHVSHNPKPFSRTTSTSTSFSSSVVVIKVRGLLSLVSSIGREERCPPRHCHPGHT
jgi:hypothetical protein